jgi:hypothetical protein
MTAVAQGYFLGRTLNPDAVCLFGEQRPGIRILPPFAFFDCKDRYDLALNVDSLTELDPRTAKAYCEAVRDRAGVWLSINHEGNPFNGAGDEQRGWNGGHKPSALLDAGRIC